MTRRFNPPPGWPRPPEGWEPDPGWRPDPSWPAAPAGWPFFVEDDTFWAAPAVVGAIRSGGGPAHDAAHQGLRADAHAPRRPQPRAWYSRKRIILPALALVGLMGIGAVQDYAGGSKPDRDVTLADAPTPSGTHTKAGKPTPAVKPTKDVGQEPVGAVPPPPESVPPKAKPPRAGTAQPPGPDPAPARKAQPPKPQPLKTRAPETVPPPKPKPPKPKPKKPKPKPTETADPNCDPNYAQACVPIASDVDCAGGGGNGPAYLSVPARIVGNDIYDLDRDGDGWACEDD